MADMSFDGGKPAVFNARSTGFNNSNAELLTGLTAATESQNAWQQLFTGYQTSDIFLKSVTQGDYLNSDSSLLIGKVVLALPYIHCYKVQLSGRNASCIAAAVSQHAHTPIGVKAGEVIPPNSDVIVWKPQTSIIAYILAVIPTVSTNDNLNASDDIQQGGNSSPKKVEAYRNILKSTQNALNWTSQSSGRPMDGTLNEYVRMSETGIGLLIDSFQTYLRVNEACGLWLNYFDSYAKLAGLSLDIQTYCEHNIQRYDEGENFCLKGHITYPWEATGMYGEEEKFTKTNNPSDVQLDKNFPFGVEEVEDIDQTPLYRLTDYTGYIGQGFNRTLIKPAKSTGKRKLSTAEAEKDTGLFQELLALDGSYSIRSAKQITLAKYPLIPNPRRKRSVEDALGDDYTESNDYRFSGLFGSGDEHKVRDWDSSTVTLVPNMLRPSGALDMLVHHYNWKSTHPFFYHKKDYFYPEEGDTDSVLNSIKFYRGNMNESYKFIAPTKLEIDSRYKDVNYFNTASFITMAEDGSIVIADGYGSQIMLGGGQIRLEAGGDVMLMSGSRVVTLAKEAIVRAKDSVDISSSNADVRLKAEVNMQLLAGNAGYGGMLIESKGQGIAQNYTNKIGEEVQGSGITLLTKGGGLNLISQIAYLRTGVTENSAEGTGDFVIDCANGNSSLVAYSKGVALFNSIGVGMWHTPSGQDQIEIKYSNFFGPNFSKIRGPLAIERDVCIVDQGNLGVDASIYAKKNIYAVENMGSKSGVLQTTNSEEFANAVNRFTADFLQYSRKVTDIGSPILNAYFTDFFWQPNLPGNTTLLENEIGFSYRDKSPNTNAVYGYDPQRFFLIETRWQQLDRMGLATGGGDTWTEKPVAYQGNELYPWPGKKNWVETESYLGYNAEDSFILFESDKAKGRETNQDKYETPVFNEWKMQVCDGNYKL